MAIQGEGGRREGAVLAGQSLLLLQAQILLVRDGDLGAEIAIGRPDLRFTFRLHPPPFPRRCCPLAGTPHATLAQAIRFGCRQSVGIRFHSNDLDHLHSAISPLRQWHSDNYLIDHLGDHGYYPRLPHLGIGHWQSCFDGGDAGGTLLAFFQMDLEVHQTHLHWESVPLSTHARHTKLARAAKRYLLYYYFLFSVKARRGA